MEEPVTEHEATDGNRSRAGAPLCPEYVHVFGYRESLRLDERRRFRLTDHLAGALAQEMGRVGAHSSLSPAARQRLAFYFVPGTKKRVFLYPAQNIKLAVNRFEAPPAGADISDLRAARDYFYSMMEFVEADRQNRLQIPEHLCDHAGIGKGEKQIVLVAHNLWLSIETGEAAKLTRENDRKSFEAIAPDVLDPVYDPYSDAEDPD